MCIRNKIEIGDNGEDNENRGLTRHDVFQSTRDKFLEKYPNGFLEDANNFAYGCLALFDTHCEDIKGLSEDQQSISKEAFFSGLMDSNI